MMKNIEEKLRDGRQKQKCHIHKIGNRKTRQDRFFKLKKKKLNLK